MSDITLETENITQPPAEDAAPVDPENEAAAPVPEVSAGGMTPEVESAPDVPEASLPPADEIAPSVPAETETRPDDVPKKARQVFSRLGLITMLVIVVGSIGQVLATSLPPSAWRETSWFLWISTFVPLYLVAFPLAWLMMRKIPACRIERERLGAARYLRLFPICIFMMLLGNYVGIGVNQLMALLPGASAENPVASYAMQENLWLKLLFLAVLAPIMEELLFRRWLIGRMRPYGERLAMVTSALMFALFHGNFSQFFYALTLGLVFGYVYLRTGRLRYSVGLHMFINFIGSILGPLLLSNVGDLDGGVFTFWRIAYSLYSAALLCAGVAGMVLFLIRCREMRFDTADKELPRGKRFGTVWLNAGMGLMTAMCLAMFYINIFGL